jgi:hypothetical protein
VAIPNVAFVMLEPRDRLFQTPLVPASVALGTKEDGALVVVDAVNPEAGRSEVLTDGRTDQTGRPGDEKSISQCVPSRRAAVERADPSDSAAPHVVHRELAGFDARKQWAGHLLGWLQVVDSPRLSSSIGSVGEESSVSWQTKGLNFLVVVAWPTYSIAIRVKAVQSLAALPTGPVSTWRRISPPARCNETAASTTIPPIVARSGAAFAIASCNRPQCAMN